MTDDDATTRLIKELTEPVAKTMAGADVLSGYRAWLMYGDDDRAYLWLAGAALKALGPMIVERDIEITRLRREVEFEALGTNPAASELLLPKAAAEARKRGHIIRAEFFEEAAADHELGRCVARDAGRNCAIEQDARKALAEYEVG